MAIVQYDSAFKKFKNSVGSYTFTEYMGKLVVKSKITNVNDPKTRKQQRVRSRCKDIGAFWRGFTAFASIIKESWNIFARPDKLVGYNRFYQINTRQIKNNEPLVISKFFDDVDLEEGEVQEELFVENFQAVTGAASGRISCSFDAIPEEWHLSLFTQEIHDGVMTANIERRDLGTNPVSPFVIPDLNPGMDYYIYAVMTHGEIADAWGISTSVAVRATASGTAPTP